MQRQGCTCVLHLLLSLERSKHAAAGPAPACCSCCYHLTMISSTKIHASPPLPGCHAGIFPKFTARMRT